MNRQWNIVGLCINKTSWDTQTRCEESSFLSVHGSKAVKDSTQLRNARKCQAAVQYICWRGWKSLQDVYLNETLNVLRTERLNCDNSRPETIIVIWCSHRMIHGCCLLGRQEYFNKYGRQITENPKEARYYDQWDNLPWLKWQSYKVRRTKRETTRTYPTPTIKRLLMRFFH